MFEALRAGAGGVMLKDAPASQLAEAVRSVARGESLLAPGPAVVLACESGMVQPGSTT